MRTCTKCGESKDESLFYKHAQYKDGLRPDCKECTSASQGRRYAELRKDPEWMAKEAERKKKRLSDPAVMAKELDCKRASAKRIRAEGRGYQYPPEKRAVSLRNYNERNRDKIKARRAVNNAIKTGRLLRQPCFCGKPGEAHHPDYSDHFRIVWLCRDHHADEHSRIHRETLLSKTQSQP